MKKQAVIGGIIVVVGVAMAVTLWPAPEPPADLAERPPEEAAAYLASEDFEKLSADKKAEVLTEVFEAAGTNGVNPRALFRDVDEEQREKLRDNVRPVMRQVMMARVTDYFELPETEQVAYLDHMIDEGGGMRGRGGPGGGPGGGPPPGGEEPDGNRPPDGERRGPSVERMKSRLESTDPADRARMQEFHKAMRERMEQRGIKPSERGPR